MGERQDPNTGPFVNLSQAYCSSLDLLARNSEPLVKNVGRANLEVLGLITRRTRAWLDLPTRVSKCRTPQDFLQEQARFWQTAAADYGESAKRLAVALGALTPVGFNGAWNIKAAAPSRDYISVQDNTSGAADDTRKRERRAA